MHKAAAGKAPGGDSHGYVHPLAHLAGEALQGSAASGLLSTSMQAQSHVFQIAGPEQQAGEAPR